MCQRCSLFAPVGSPIRRYVRGGRKVLHLIYSREYLFRCCPTPTPTPASDQQADKHNSLDRNISPPTGTVEPVPFYVDYAITPIPKLTKPKPNAA